jgi:hypothetical protein
MSRNLLALALTILVSIASTACPGKLPTDVVEQPRDPDGTPTTLIYTPDSMWIGQQEDPFGYSVNGSVWDMDTLTQQPDGTFRFLPGEDARTLLCNLQYGNEIQWIADKYGLDGTLEVLFGGTRFRLDDSFLVDASPYGDANVSIFFDEASDEIFPGPGIPLAVIRDSVVVIGRDTHFINIWFQVYSFDGGWADVDDIHLFLNGSLITPPVDMGCESTDGWMSSLWMNADVCGGAQDGVDIFTKDYLAVVPGSNGNAIRISVPEGGHFTEMYMEFHLPVLAGDELTMDAVVRTNGAGVRIGIDEYETQSNTPRPYPYGISGAYKWTSSWTRVSTLRKGC